MAIDLVGLKGNNMFTTSTVLPQDQLTAYFDYICVLKFKLKTWTYLIFVYVYI